MLMGLKLFHEDDVRSAHARIQMIPSFTDNRGNGSADVEQVPIKRECLGICFYLKKDVDQGSRPLGSTNRKLRGRRARERQHQQVRPGQAHSLTYGETYFQRHWKRDVRRSVSA